MTLSVGNLLGKIRPPVDEEDTTTGYVQIGGETLRVFEVVSIQYLGKGQNDKSVMNVTLREIQ